MASSIDVTRRSLRTARRRCANAAFARRCGRRPAAASTCAGALTLCDAHAFDDNQLIVDAVRATADRRAALSAAHRLPIASRALARVSRPPRCRRSAAHALSVVQRARAPFLVLLAADAQHRRVVFWKFSACRRVARRFVACFFDDASLAGGKSRRPAFDARATSQHAGA